MPDVSTEFPLPIGLLWDFEALLDLLYFSVGDRSQRQKHNWSSFQTTSLPLAFVLQIKPIFNDVPFDIRTIFGVLTICNVSMSKRETTHHTSHAIINGPCLDLTFHWTVFGLKREIIREIFVNEAFESFLQALVGHSDCFLWICLSANVGKILARSF